MVEGMPEAFCANLTVIVGLGNWVVRALEVMSNCLQLRFITLYT